MRLNLLVIRSKVPKQLASFYASFGISFEQHRHGAGPIHFSAALDTVILEIYPLLASQQEIDKGLRLGFLVQGLDNHLERLKSENIEITQMPIVTDWGYRAIIKDIEGRKIELVEME